MNIALTPSKAGNSWSDIERLQEDAVVRVSSRSSDYHLHLQDTSVIRVLSITRAEPECTKLTKYRGFPCSQSGVCRFIKYFILKSYYKTVI